MAKAPRHSFARALAVQQPEMTIVIALIWVLQTWLRLVACQLEESSLNQIITWGMCLVNHQPEASTSHEMIPSKLGLNFVEGQMVQSQKISWKDLWWPSTGYGRPCPALAMDETIFLKRWQVRQIHQQHTKCNCEEAKHRYCKISMSINLEILWNQTQTIYTTPPRWVSFHQAHKQKTN